jgi:hypothetical protein
MDEPLQPSAQPTAYPDVNAALAELLMQVQGVLGAHFVGMYLSGSLALGDFDPDGSDIDLIVVSDDVLDSAHVAALQAMHAQFIDATHACVACVDATQTCVACGNASNSPWAAKVEAVYITRDALRHPALHAPNATHYPQVEKRRGFFMDCLEDGWLCQCITVREHGVALAGPDPHTLIDPVDPDAMRRAIALIPATWLDQAHNDPSWLEWLRIREHQAFVTLTLCRLLYTLEVGSVASKPAAARWAQKALGTSWMGLIERALGGQHDHSRIAERDVIETVALVEYTVERFQYWQSSLHTSASD